MNQITYGYVGCCPICGQAPVGGREYLCGHNPSTNQQSASADDPRDATIRELRALCAEAYRFICRTSSAPYSVCGHPRSDEYAEIELKLKAAAQALEETAQRIRKEIKG